MPSLPMRIGAWLSFIGCLSSCSPPNESLRPTIEFTKLPQAGEGSPDGLAPIEGRVTDAQPGQRIVLFARSGIWWVQPTRAEPFTAIQRDSRWKNMTHPGSAYAALLVGPEYRPVPTLNKLPEKGGAILAKAVAEGAQLVRPAGKTVSFSGYEWEIREIASDRSGTRNLFDPANVWTDKKGFLHLRVKKGGAEWTSAEVRLSRSLGYGTYRVAVRNVSHLEPAAVFSIVLWDDTGPLEMDVEVSRWGEPAAKNSQYVIQPYYVPANVFRFNTPPGVVTYSFRWQPGRAAFRTELGSRPRRDSAAVAEHIFTSGVPSPGNEAIHMNLYVFWNKRNPLRDGTEVIVEKFEYLP